MQRSAMRRRFPSRASGVRHSFFFSPDDCVMPLRMVAERNAKVNHCGGARCREASPQAKRPRAHSVRRDSMQEMKDSHA
jgi:hypothetical protein